MIETKSSSPRLETDDKSARSKIIVEITLKGIVGVNKHNVQMISINDVSEIYFNGSSKEDK
jgi:hypothetical protein